MAKFVKNPSGTVHSVDDDFEPLSGEEFADEWSEGQWAVVTEADASDQLLGKESDPEVDFHELRDPAETVIDESGPAEGPGEVDGREPNDIEAEPADETPEEEAK